MTVFLEAPDSPGASPDRADLDSVEEISTMVRRFYGTVTQDDLLGPLFNDVADVDWPEHLDKLVAFWSRALLGIPGYSGNPFSKHLNVHKQAPFGPALFERWLDLFHDNLTSWSGPNTDRAGELVENVAKVHAEQLERMCPSTIVDHAAQR